MERAERLSGRAQGGRDAPAGTSIRGAFHPSPIAALQPSSAGMHAAPVQQRGDHAASGPQLLQPPDALAQPHAELLRGCRQRVRNEGRGGAGQRGEWGWVERHRLNQHVSDANRGRCFQLAQLVSLSLLRGASRKLSSPCTGAPTHLARRLAGPAAAGTQPPAQGRWRAARPLPPHPARERQQGSTRGWAQLGACKHEGGARTKG